MAREVIDVLENLVDELEDDDLSVHAAVSDVLYCELVHVASFASLHLCA